MSNYIYVQPNSRFMLNYIYVQPNSRFMLNYIYVQPNSRFMSNYIYVQPNSQALANPKKSQELIAKEIVHTETSALMWKHNDVQRDEISIGLWGMKFVFM